MNSELEMECWAPNTEPNYKRLYLLAERQRGLLLLQDADRASRVVIGFAAVGISGFVVGFLIGWWL